MQTTSGIIRRLGELYDRANEGESRLYYYFTVSDTDIGEIFTAVNADIYNTERQVFGCFGGNQTESKDEFIENMVAQ